MTARDRELWEALVFDTFDNFRWGSIANNDRGTEVIPQRTVPTIRICIQSSDDSHTGERLARYAVPSWWQTQIRRWTNLTWNNSIQIGACAGQAPAGWIYVREGEPGEVNATALAHATSGYFYYPNTGQHGWSSSEIVWNPELVRSTDEDYFEKTLAHELGHVMGFYHAPRGSGFIMVSGERSTWPDKERWLAQWAYAVGPGVQYPGFIRPNAPEPPGPGSLSDGVKDLVDEALDELNDDSNGRQATESVPALPVAGLLSLAILLGLLGWRRLHAG